MASRRAPWHATARELAQRIGIEPRSLRRLRWLHKARAVRRSGHQIRRHWQFVLASPEPDNYTYEITNVDELAGWAAGVARCEEAAARALVLEPSHDVELAERLRTATARHWLWTKPAPPFGKRLGWYALARALRPRRVIEIGAHDGLGSMLLLRALELNERDGFPGTLVSFDVNPSAGWLVGEHRLWELRIQSSEEGLPQAISAAAQLDMLIYDGWHTFEAEYADLRVAADRLASDGVLVSDDAQVTQALARLCEERGFDYSEFQEVPVDHFYPGAMLGAGRRPA
ncbi:MAG: class I SAM-dependent methyltransferase [Solirubrobacteraceae bacterium]